jgi:hypothetical protein
VTDETAIYLRVRGNIVCVNGRSAVAGRSRNCDVQLDEQGVSRRHCEVLLRDDGASIRDLGSSHGTWVGGRRISGEERLATGVLVTLGAKGPHFELVNAIVHGRPVLGAAAAPPRDEWSPVLRNALAAGDHPGFTVWSHALPGGRNDLDLGQGAYVVLGFVKTDARLEPRMVFFGPAAQSRPDLDWLFE